MGRSYLGGHDDDRSWESRTVRLIHDDLAQAERFLRLESLIDRERTLRTAAAFRAIRRAERAATRARHLLVRSGVQS